MNDRRGSSCDNKHSLCLAGSMLARRCLLHPLHLPASFLFRSLTTTTIPASATMGSIQPSSLFDAIRQHDPKSTAIIHSRSGRSFQYGSLLQDVAQAKASLLKTTGKDDKSIEGERIAFLIENSYDYVGVSIGTAMDWAGT